MFPYQPSLLLGYRTCVDNRTETALLYVHSTSKGKVIIHALTTGTKPTHYPFQSQTPIYAVYGDMTPNGNRSYDKCKTSNPTGLIPSLNRIGVPEIGKTPSDLDSLASIQAFLNSLGQTDRYPYPELIALPPFQVFKGRLAALAQNENFLFKGHDVLITPATLKDCTSIPHRLGSADYEISSTKIPLILIVPSGFRPGAITLEPPTGTNSTQQIMLTPEHPFPGRERTHCLEIKHLAFVENSKQYFVVIADTDGRVITDTLRLPNSALTAALDRQEPQVQESPPPKKPETLIEAFKQQQEWSDRRRSANPLPFSCNPGSRSL